MTDTLEPIERCKAMPLGPCFFCDADVDGELEIDCDVDPNCDVHWYVTCPACGARGAGGTTVRAVWSWRALQRATRRPTWHWFVPEYLRPQWPCTYRYTLREQLRLIFSSPIKPRWMR